MGKKGGSSAPAPDPRLVAAQIKSLGIQDDMVQQIIRQSEEFAPLQKEQLQFSLDSAKTAYDQSQQDREWMLGRRENLTGLQDQMVKDAEEFNSEARQRELRGQALTDVNTAFGNARDQGLRTMSRMGVNPNSGKALAMNNQASIAQAAALSSAANKTAQAARQEGYALTDRAANALAGYPAMGMQATQQGLQTGTAGQTIANQGLAGMNSGYGMGLQGAGQMGQNATNMWGQQAQHQANMQQQGGSGLGGILGGIGGIVGAGAAAGWWSDRRLKTDIVAVGRDERTGLTLYEFAYKDVPGHRFRGVMADEVRAVMPEAVLTGADCFDAVDYGLLGIEFVEVEP